MTLYRGNTKVQTLYHGSDVVEKLYRGDTLVYDAFEPVPPGEELNPPVEMINAGDSSRVSHSTFQGRPLIYWNAAYPGRTEFEKILTGDLIELDENGVKTLIRATAPFNAGFNGYIYYNADIDSPTDNRVTLEARTYNLTRIWVGAPDPNAIRNAILALSPVAYWPMDDASGSPQDISGSGYHLTVNGAVNYLSPLANGVEGIHVPNSGVSGSLSSPEFLHPAEVTFLVYVQDVDGSVSSSHYTYMGNWTTGKRTLITRRSTQNSSISPAQIYLNPPSGQKGTTVGPTFDWAQGVLVAVTAGNGGCSVMLRGHDGQTFDNDPWYTWSEAWAVDLSAELFFFQRELRQAFSGFAVAHGAVIPSRLTPTQVDDLWSLF